MSPSNEKLQSPFLDISSFPAEESEVAEKQETPSPWYEAESPFQSIYKLDDKDVIVDPEAENFVSFLAELHDQKFDEAILELVNEASSLYETQIQSEFGNFSTQNIEAERMLGEHFAPLSREMETFLEALAKDVETRDLNTLTEGEINTFIDQYVPAANLSPNFENFFGSWKKKLKKLARKGLSLAKKGLKAAASLGLGPILRKLKRYIKPLLRKVLKKAIRKLPNYLQPVAKGLARRYLGRYIKEVEAEEQFESGEDATGDITRVQDMLDQQISHLLFAADEVEQEAMLSETIVESEQRTDDQLRQLERARYQFIREVGELEEGEDPTKLLENFLPALLPILKMGIKLGGRNKVVNFLAKYLAKLIRRFVGRRYARPLSRAVVDLGLKYFGLETTEKEALSAAGEAVAYTVEETMRKVSALPDYILEDEQLLEGEVLRAFETAAAAYLPPVLPEKVYEDRPDLRETASVEGFWAGLPVRSRKRYRKFTGRFPVIKLKPHTIKTVKTWRGQPLSAHLRNQLGLPVGRTLAAQIHLYEAMPGTSLQEIARMEKNVPGLENTKTAWPQLHPLSKEAAGLLIGEVGLGRDVSKKYVNDPLMPPAVGQRFYFLEISEAHPQMATASGGTPIMSQLSEINLIIDFSGGLIRAYIFVSESKAQQLAIKLRQHTPVGIVLTALKSEYEPNMKAALSGGMYRRVRVIHNSLTPEQSDGQSLKWLPQVVREKLEEKLLEWLGRSLGADFPKRSQEFVNSTEADADGVTVIVTLKNPPGLPKLSRVLGGEPVVLRGKWFSSEIPESKIQIVPGYQHD